MQQFCHCITYYTRSRNIDHLVAGLMLRSVGGGAGKMAEREKLVVLLGGGGGTLNNSGEEEEIFHVFFY